MLERFMNWLNHQYFTVTVRHKFYVGQAIFKTGAPWYMAIIHDWSKFRPTEYALYQYEFFGSAPNDRGKVKGSRAHYAFKMHYKRNKHHWQYWVTDWGNRRARLMPTKYIKEMVADWMGASRAYAGTWDITPWMNRHAHEMILHPLTRSIVYDILGELGVVVIDPVNTATEIDHPIVYIYPGDLSVIEWCAAKDIFDNDDHRYAGRRIIMIPRGDLYKWISR